MHGNDSIFCPCRHFELIEAGDEARQVQNRPWVTFRSGLKSCLADAYLVVQVKNYDKIVGWVIELRMQGQLFYSVLRALALKQAVRHRGNLHANEGAAHLALAIEQQLLVLERVIQQVIVIDLTEDKHVARYHMIILPLEFDLAEVGAVAKCGKLRER